MAATALLLGALPAPGFVIRKSGISWLYPDGYACRKNQVVGFCNISVKPPAGLRPPGAGMAAAPFAGEASLQVALAAPAAGRLRIDAETSFGGFLNFLAVQTWNAETVVGHLEPAGAAAPNSLPMRHLLLAGRLITGLADFGKSLLPGWHAEVRGWWTDEAAAPRTLLSLGMCDASGAIRGEQSAFLEIYEEAGFPLHVVAIDNEPLVNCAVLLLEQFFRTEAEFDLIADDMKQAVFNGPIPAAPEDYLFVGTMLGSLKRCPLRQAYDVITPAGLRKTRPPEAVLLSASAEPMSTMRHRRLGYHLLVHRFRLAAAGAATRAWLKSAFENVPRSMNAIRDDYLRLRDALRAVADTKLLIVNRMSTSGREDIVLYAPFEAPMGNLLVQVAAKEMNLMLHDLEAAGDIFIVDADAIAAELGGADHLPDGVHQSGAMQTRVRREILDIIG